MARGTRSPCVRMLPAATNVLGGGGSSNGGWLGLARSMRSEMESRLMLSVRAARPERRGPYAHAPQTDQLHHGGDRSVLRPLRRPVAALRGAHRTASVPDWLALAARAQQDAGRSL